MVERFHRNRSKSANKDVAERVFLLAQRRIEVTYHVEDNRFIPSKRSFIKPRDSTGSKKAEDFTPDMVSSFQVQTTNTLSELPLRSHAPIISTSASLCTCLCGGVQVELSEEPLKTLTLYEMLLDLMMDEEKVVLEIKKSKKEVT